MHQSKVYALISILLGTTATICLVYGILAVIGSQIPSGLSLLGAALVLFFAATLERFESLKGLGVEAKLVKLDQKIHEASHLLSQIKLVAEIVGKASLSMYSRVGRFSGPPSHEEMYDLIQKVNQSLVSMGSSQAVIREALDPCTRIMQLDLVRALTKNFDLEILTRIRGIQDQRTGVTPDLAQSLMVQIDELQGVRDQLRQCIGIDLPSFPANLVTLLRSSPASDVLGSGEAAQHLVDFTPEIMLLRATGTLHHPAKWFATVASAQS